MRKPESIIQLKEAFNGLLSPEGHSLPLAELEKRAILMAIYDTRGHMSEAARRLGISRSTLYTKWDSLKQSNYQPEIVMYLCELITAAGKPYRTASRTVSQTPKQVHYFTVPDEASCLLPEQIPVDDVRMVHAALEPVNA